MLRTLRKKYIILPLLLVSISAFFSFYNLTNTPAGLYIDEAMNGNNALEAVRTGDFKIFYPENGGREGLFINAQALALASIGLREPWVLRSVAGLGGIATILGFYLLAVLILESLKTPPSRARIYAFLGTLLMQTSFWFIDLSRLGLRVNWTSLFLVWSLVILWQTYKKSLQTHQSPSPLMLLFAGCIYGIGWHTYISYRITPLILIGFFIFLKKTLKLPQAYKPKEIGVFIAGVLIPLLPLALFFMSAPELFIQRASEVSIFSSASPLILFIKNILRMLGMLVLKGDANWRHNISGYPQLGIIPAALFIGTLVWGFFFSKDKPQKNTFFFLASWILIGALPAALSNEGIPHALRGVLMMIPSFIICTLGIRHIGECACLKAPRRAIIGALLVAVCMIGNGYWTYFKQWAPRPEVYDEFLGRQAEMAREIQSIPRTVPVYIITDMPGVPIRGIPASTQPLMFLTDTFSPNAQKERDIHYLSPHIPTHATNGGIMYYLSR